MKKQAYLVKMIDTVNRMTAVRVIAKDADSACALALSDNPKYVRAQAVVHRFQ